MEPLLARDAWASGAIRRGSVRRLRPGVYVENDDWHAAPSRERHLVRMMAAARALTGRMVFSHASAAAWWGFPSVGPWPEQVSASYDGAAGRAPRAGLRWHRASWGEGDVVRVGTMMMTSPRRTAIDLARTGTLVDGVVALDHVFARDVQRADVLGWVERCRPFHGVRRLESALDLAHGLSESPLESLSLARLAEAGAPRPVQQHQIITAQRQRYRVDFFWPELGIVGEADGRAKYHDPEDLWREKRREDAIRPLVRRFVRWSWADAVDLHTFAALLRRSGIPTRV